VNRAEDSAPAERSDPVEQAVEPKRPSAGVAASGVDSTNPFEEMMSRFDVAAQKLGLDPGL
jgi:hypothetical protein